MSNKCKHNNQGEYDYYGHQSVQDIEDIAAICFAVVLLLLLVAGIIGAAKLAWKIIHMLGG